MDQMEAALTSVPGASRMWDEDPDSDEEGYEEPEQLAAPVVLWGNPDATLLRRRCLIVGLRGGGSLFTQNCLCEGAAMIGAVIMPQTGGQSLPRTVEEAAEEPESALIYDVGDALVVNVQYFVAAERAREWAAALLAAAPAEHVSVLNTVAVQSFFNTEVEIPTPPLLLKLETPAQQAKNLAPMVQPLPAPNHADGLSAAIFEHVMLAGGAASIYLSLQDAQDVSSKTLLAFAPAVEACGIKGLAENVLRQGCNKGAVQSSSTAEIGTRNRMYL